MIPHFFFPAENVLKGNFISEKSAYTHPHWNRLPTVRLAKASIFLYSNPFSSQEIYLTQTILASNKKFIMSTVFQFVLLFNIKSVPYIVWELKKKKSEKCMKSFVMFRSHSE